jgi:hypothetical protein
MRNDAIADARGVSNHTDRIGAVIALRAIRVIINDLSSIIARVDSCPTLDARPRSARTTTPLRRRNHGGMFDGCHAT